MWGIRELESLLYEHPGVWDVAAIKETDEELSVYVQLRAGFNLAACDLMQFCRQLGNSLMPSHLYVVNKLPKTKTGKISRGDLLNLQPISVCNF